MPTLSSLLVSVELDEVNSSLIVTDLIGNDYNVVYGYTLADVKGLIKITGDQTGTVYKNAGWDNDNYSSPDTSSTSWIKTLSSTIPVGSNGKILKQYYTIEYKITVNAGLTTSFTFSQTFQNIYEATTNLITSTLSLINSTYEFVDSTNYTLTLSGNTYTTTPTRSWTIVWPTGSGKPNTTSTATSVTLGPNIWSGYYTITFYATVSYTLVNAVSGLTVTVSDKIENSASDNRVAATYQNFTALVNSELEVITATYESYKLYNIPYAQQYQDILADLMMYFNMYRVAYVNNTDMGYSMTKIYDILNTDFLNITVTLEVAEIFPSSVTPSYGTFRLVSDIYTAVSDGQTTFTLTSLIGGTMLQAIRDTQPQKLGVTGEDLSYDNTTGLVTMVRALNQGENIFFIIEQPI